MSKLNIQPLGDRVLIEPLEKEGKEKKTESGIVLPETAKEDERIIRGKVLVAGPGKYNEDGEIIPMTVRKGQVVLFSKGYMSQPMKVEGKEYLLVREDDILAIVE